MAVIVISILYILSILIPAIFFGSLISTDKFLNYFAPRPIRAFFAVVILSLLSVATSLGVQFTTGYVAGKYYADYSYFYFNDELVFMRGYTDESQIVLNENTSTKFSMSVTFNNTP